MPDLERIAQQELMALLRVRGGAGTGARHVGARDLHVSIAAGPIGAISRRQQGGVGCGSLAILRRGALEVGARAVLGRLAHFGLSALFAQLREPLRDVGLLSR